MVQREACLGVHILVDLEGLAKGKNVLRKSSKLPHVPDAVQHGGLFGFWWFGRDRFLHLLTAPLARRHHIEADAVATIEGWRFLSRRRSGRKDVVVCDDGKTGARVVGNCKWK